MSCQAQQYPIRFYISEYVRTVLFVIPHKPLCQNRNVRMVLLLGLHDGQHAIFSVLPLG